MRATDERLLTELDLLNDHVEPFDTVSEFPAWDYEADYLEWAEKILNVPEDLRFSDFALRSPFHPEFDERLARMIDNPSPSQTEAP